MIARRHFPALDGLRAVAVLTVIVGHREYPIRGVPGDLGVSAFFVLSGFLITRLLIRERESAGTVSLTGFYARRTIRIFPAYYSFLLFSFMLDRAQGAHWSAELGLSAVTYTMNYFNALNHHPTNSISHAWSLAVEEQFYLVWPILFLLLARRGRRALATGVTVAALLAVARRLWLTAHGADVAYLYNAFDTRFDNLAVGCLFAIVADHERVVRAAAVISRQAWYPLVTIALLLTSRLFTVPWYHYTAGLTVNAILVMALIAQLLLLYATPLWSWLEHPVTRYLGTISYPMYLYHQWGDAVGRHAASGEGGVFLVGVLATIALASGSYYVVEKPFLRLKGRFHAPVFPTPALPAVVEEATT